MEIRERIERLIAERHITKAELAKRLDIDASTLHRRLTGERKRDEEFLRGVARVLDVSVAYLLGEVQVIKSDVTEVSVFDLVSGQLVAEGVHLMPSVLTTATTIIVRDGETTFFIDEESAPVSGQRALLNIGGRVTIQRVIMQGERIKVGNTVLDRDSVLVLGRVVATYVPEREEF